MAHLSFPIHLPKRLAARSASTEFNQWPHWAIQEVEWLDLANTVLILVCREVSNKHSNNAEGDDASADPHCGQEHSGGTESV